MENGIKKGTKVNYSSFGAPVQMPANQPNSNSVHLGMYLLNFKLSIRMRKKLDLNDWS